MKLVHFSRKGQSSWGSVTADGIIDLGRRFPKYQGIRQVLEAAAIDEIKPVGTTTPADFPLSEVTLQPPLPDARRVFCAGVNYDEHRHETGRSKTENPVIFMRFAEAQVAHGQPMVKPRESDLFDYEGELAVIIGKGGRRIARETALSHIAGYSCYNDGSIRDYQRHTHQFTPGKNWDGTGAFGPWMVTADEIADPTKLTLVTRLNGQIVQESTTDMMIFDIPALISYISTWTTLHPGDVIATGTPGGVGDKRTPPLYMKDGDVAEVSISSVGVLRNPIIAE